MRARLLLGIFGALLVSFMLTGGPSCIKELLEERREGQIEAFQDVAQAVAHHVRRNKGHWPADWQALGFDKDEAERLGKWVEVDFAFDPKAILKDPSAVRSAVTPRWDFREDEDTRRAQIHLEWWMLAHEVGRAHGEWVVLPEQDLPPPGIAAEAAVPAM
jgi:hypothetical protein